MSDLTVNEKIEELEEQYNKIELEYDLKLEEITDEIEELKRNKCPDCDGTGEKHYSTGYPDYIINTCDMCFGTGALQD